MLRCKNCGATKDYLIEKEGKIECCICGNDWRINPSKIEDSFPVVKRAL